MELATDRHKTQRSRNHIKFDMDVYFVDEIKSNYYIYVYMYIFVCVYTYESI